MEASMLVNGATFEEVEAVISDAIPPGISPFAVLTYRATGQGVEVSPGGANRQRRSSGPPSRIRLHWPK
jgi:hypothetical protein